jgi:hypothetical protein
LREVYNNNVNNSVDGSPYLYESWNNLSKIYYKDKIYTINSFNYNLYADRFEAKLSSDSVFVINQESVKKVTVNNNVFSQYKDPESQKTSYFEELIDFDGYRFLRKYNTKIKEASTNPLTKEKLSNDQLIKFETYFLCQLNDHNLTQINLKKSSVQSLFSKEKLDFVNRFVKDNHLKYNDIKDVVKIVKYYNAL